MQIYACWVCILLTAIWKIKTNTTPPSFISFQQLQLSYAVNQNPFSSNNVKADALKENVHSEFSQQRSKLGSFRWTFTVPLYHYTKNATPKLDSDRKCWSFENHGKPSMPLKTLPISSFKLLNKKVKEKKWKKKVLFISVSLNHLINAVHLENEASCQWEFYLH